MFTEGFGVLGLCRHHVVEGSRLAIAVGAQLCIHVVSVVQHLILRAALPDGEVIALGVFGFLGQIEDAGVAALAYLVLTLKGEVGELVCEEQVAAALCLSLTCAASLQVDAAVGALPALWHSVHAVAAPSVQAGSVIEDIVVLGVLLQLGQVVLLVFYNLRIGCHGYCILGFVLTVCACLAVAIALLASAA